MEVDWKAQQLQHEGRFHNYDILLVPHKNDSEKIMWKKSYERKFVDLDKFKISHKIHSLEIVYMTLPPFNMRNKDGNLVGIDANTWKIIGSHLHLDMKFTDAISIGRLKNMVKDSLTYKFLSYCQEIFYMYSYFYKS